MLFAVTLHNIPEGMSVGVMYADLLSGSADISAGGALTLALGITIQNVPEGAIISMPLHAEGKSKSFSFSEVLYPVQLSRRRFDYYSCIRAYGSCNAVFTQLCHRRNDICRRGGACSRNVRGRTLQHRRIDVCSWFYSEDDFEYRFRII